MFISLLKSFCKEFWCLYMVFMGDGNVLVVSDLRKW